MDSDDGDGVPSVRRRMDLPEVIVWIVGIGSLVGPGVSLYQRDWSQIAGPAATTKGMVCLIFSRKLARHAK